jgi:acyl carrier protein
MQQLQTQDSNPNSNSAEAVSSLLSIQAWLVEQIADVLSLDASTIDIKQPLTRYGLDSIDAVTLVGDLEDWLDLELPSTLLWDYPTIEKASTYMVEEFDVVTP